MVITKSDMIIVHVNYNFSFQVEKQVPEEVCLTVPRQNARRQCMNVTMDECDVVERRGFEDKCDLVPATVPTVRQCKSVPASALRQSHSQIENPRKSSFRVKV